MLGQFYNQFNWAFFKGYTPPTGCGGPGALPPPPLPKPAGPAGPPGPPLMEQTYQLEWWLLCKLQQQDSQAQVPEPRHLHPE